MSLVRHIARMFGVCLLCLPWLAGAQAPLRDASVDTMVDRLAPPAAENPAAAAAAGSPSVRSLRNLVPQPTVPQTSPPPRQLDLVVAFDFDSADLSAQGQALLDKLSQALGSDRLAASRFRIEGHTDAKGAAAYNKALSERRAQAVVVYLGRQGVAAERLQAVGMGFEALLLKDQPFAAENRRVRIVTLE